MKTKLVYTLALCLCILSFFLYMDKADSVRQIQSEKEHFEYQYNQLKSRVEVQNQSNFHEVPLDKFFGTKAVGNGDVSQTLGQKLFLVLPSTGCSTCFDVVIQEIKQVLTLKPELQSQITCITDTEALDQVKTYLENAKLGIDIWLRKDRFELPIDQPGYPYLFYGTIADQMISVKNTLVPDTQDTDLTRSFMNQLADMAADNGLTASN